MSCFQIKALSIWIVAVGIAEQVRSQTVELTSSQLSVLADAERERFLAAHNVARREVEVDPVCWSDELSSYALESLVQQKDALIEGAKEGWMEKQAVLPNHRVDSPYGENVAAWVGTRRYAAEGAVELWLREKADFDKLNAISPYRVGDEKTQSEADPADEKQPIIVGHYTAIVWKATRQIGAAKLDFDLTDDQGNRRSYTAVICNYNPPGNRHGEKPF
jgi:pathogenesis-related protein 1